MKYTLIEADGTTTLRESIDLNEIQNFLGGQPEIVGNMMSNDDQIRLNLPYNIVFPKIRGNVIVENR